MSCCQGISLRIFFKLLNQIPISFAGPYKESFFTQTGNYTGRSVANYPAVALLEKKLP
jgi:hypothetical protein